MSNFNKRLWIALAVFTAAPVSATPILQVQFTTPTAVVGDAVEAEVFVSNLEGEFVSTYDLTLTWNPAFLSFGSVAFNTLLDGPVDSFQDVVATGTSLNVAEVSWGLLLNQTGFDAFRLFTVTFDTISAGMALLDFEPGALLGDYFGEAYTDVAFGAASLSVTQRPVAVSEPPTLGILLLGLALVLAMRQATLRRGVAPQVHCRG